uniref:Uncharacterized protein n=1 Tax=Anguilla anguilla TaxID=7936 RepID=A0A0E9RU67_ANGAN
MELENVDLPYSFMFKNASNFTLQS